MIAGLFFKKIEGKKYEYKSIEDISADHTTLLNNTIVVDSIKGKLQHINFSTYLILRDKLEVPKLKMQLFGRSRTAAFRPTH